MLGLYAIRLCYVCVCMRWFKCIVAKPDAIFNLIAAKCIALSVSRVRVGVKSPYIIQSISAAAKEP